jgi:ribonuclease BN (tRNA processing enzyme)
VRLMLLRVLGNSGAEFPGHYTTSFLIDGTILLDAGTIGSRLTEAEQWNIKYILITHSHLDHIKGIPFLADNVVIKNKKHTIMVMGLRESLSSLRRNLLNDEIWPDFTKISANVGPVLKLEQISTLRTFALNGYKIRACRVNHTVPAVGYLIENADGKVLLYTGDTGPTNNIWSVSDNVHTAIVEVSFPNRMHELAKKTGHLTPKLLVSELEKMKNFPEKIFITHPKPQYIGQITKEVRSIANSKIKMLKDGITYKI